MKNIADHRQARRAPVKPPSASHSLDALLNTIRCMAHYEDALCELSHDLRRTGGLTPEIGDELREILEKIPYRDYVLDLDGLKIALESQQSAKSVSGKSAKPVPPGKSFAAAKKTFGRKSSK